ncbi:PhzF family phenazine biosynthesis protein [Pseudoalteromonas sp. SR43-6]|uniref:PhzF family phenazine biosynthesis protein n=1 Tax=unclassified Pseudoalteromonas TaxID=194690 RepID=UPI0015F79618|nr:MULTISPECIES: PhzF family phenazine biosynthesis protein [unclassified Pseudoalteromonas]MBB1287871.1 PhzF family phenazine biosynthesis protein [Pseudoalteromonas sp. SR41-5]MBB1372999.1 PhzF family phenazine biosynthesis protein [Pseudoalteromonas sp. SR43-6]MBB1412512.1 PhzF family phenazine biosynthesis protein [Pseudoalteromonas sp. SG43-8]
MQAKDNTLFLTKRKPKWLTLRCIKLTSTESVFYSPANNLKGSSALIVIYKIGLTSKTMQYIASQSNHPATVFLNQNEITKRHCNIRWFNQTSEIKRCGHGTLAAANFLIKYFGYCPEVFTSMSNERFIIRVKKQRAQLLLKSIESKKSELAKGELQSVFSLAIKAAYSAGENNGYTVVLFNEEFNKEFSKDVEKDDLKSLHVDFKALSKLHKNAVIALSIKNIDKKNAIAHFRYFAPQFGVNEDSATGSAVSVIAPLLFRLHGLNKAKLIQQSNNGALLSYEFSNAKVVIY